MRMGIENEIGNDARLLGHGLAPVLGWPNPLYCTTGDVTVLCSGMTCSCCHMIIIMWM